MIVNANEIRFTTGRLVATPGAFAALGRNGQAPAVFLRRHARGDWGDVDAHDRKANDAAVKHAGRLLSAYTLNDATRIWVVTEADRSSTCILLPEEY